VKPVAIYARVSSERQKEEQTIGSQVAALLEYAQAHGDVVAPEWIFKDEGYSGSLLVRPGLERVRDLAAEGQIEKVLVYAPDRLSRKYAYQVLLLEEFSRHGVDIIFIKSPVATTPEEQLLIQFQGMIAEYERAQIVERSRRGKRYRAKMGLVNVLCGAPYGYRYIKKTDNASAFYEVLEEQAQIVRRVYAWYTEEGLSIGAIVRRLNDQGVATRLGKSPWERTTVWAMLRNPAYQGTACFGKTEKTERKKITRALRQRGGFSKRSSSNRDRPREEWIEIPVPAIVSADAFALAQDRLQKNKQFSPRHTIEPTLLQGILVCRECSYAYYRTSTETSSRKIYYYRCLGSDRYRHPKGAVCSNRPIRQDYLDALIWNHVMEVLKNPDLIRAEIDRRIQEVRSSSPAKMRKDVLLKEIARVQKSVNRLLDAYQEGLFPLEQMRRRIPEMKKRETALQAELQSLEAGAVDQQKCEMLMSSLGGFLDRLQKSAETLDVLSRQNILRLIVKEVLVGPETVTVRHSIPTGDSTTPTAGTAPSGTPEAPSYLLRGRSHFPAVGECLLE
jgi:site-specific DNA recombinase